MPKIYPRLRPSLYAVYSGLESWMEGQPRRQALKQAKLEGVFTTRKLANDHRRMLKLMQRREHVIVVPYCLERLVGKKRMAASKSRRPQKTWHERLMDD